MPRVWDKYGNEFFAPEDALEPLESGSHSLGAWCNTVCELTGMTPAELKSHRASRRYARPRQILCYLAVKHTTLSLPAIGRWLGKRDHTTIIHANTAIKAILAGEGNHTADHRRDVAEVIAAAEARHGVQAVPDDRVVPFPSVARPRAVLFDGGAA